MDMTNKSEYTASSSRAMKEKDTSLATSQAIRDPFRPENTKKARGDCQESQSTSHTHFYKKDIYLENAFERITRDEFMGISESISGSSDTYHCVHGPRGKLYSEKGLLKRNLQKELDPIPKDPNWEEKCPPAYGWDMAKRLEFLITDPTGVSQMDRIVSHLHDFAKISLKGFKIDTLERLIIIVDYLVENNHKTASLRECLVLLLKNMRQPIMLNVNSDVITYFEVLRQYIGYSGYLLLRLEDDALFDLVAEGLLWHLTVSDKIRGHSAVQLRHTLAAAVPVLYDTTVRMLALASAHRFPTFLDIAFILACDTTDNCMEMMRDNICENIFYRFNPYFPDRPLPVYDINPANPQDIYVKLGDSSVNICTTMSLLLVLLKTMKLCLEQDPTLGRKLPCPDDYAQRCFIWAYRYECRARDHKNQRMTMTVIAHMMLHVFKDRLATFSDVLMPDIISLSVLTELPPRTDWTATVNFDRAQRDVFFKKQLIFLSVDLLKIFPYNRFMIESRNWLVGVMYLIDPGLCHLRARWSNSLFAELRRTALQALLLTVMRIEPGLVVRCGLIRRIMWYIEWYSESPYEMLILYWCVRLLQTSLFPRRHQCRSVAMRSLFDTHGIIIILNLCNTLLAQKMPPLEKTQSILAVCLRMLVSAAECQERVKCCVYADLRWPGSILTFTRKMLDVVLYSLDKHHIVSDSWLLALLNFIWENVAWKPDLQKTFVTDDGIYKLLDIVAVSRYPVQCLSLAVISDIARADGAVGHLVTWRANLRADSAYPQTVKRGSTIVSLLAAVFRRDCEAMGIRLDTNGVIQDVDCPLFSSEMKKQLDDPDFKECCHKRTPYSLAASELAGSRCSKAYAIYHLLSEDLKHKVALANDAYKIYKGIKLSTSDEALLVLVSNYLTIKLIQTWEETRVQCSKLVPQDEAILKEFLQISRNYMKEIKRQQEDIVERNEKREHAIESDLYTFLGRARLNVALDALRETRCLARTADRSHMAYTLLLDAVRAYHRRSTAVKRLQAPLIRTYGPTLDHQVRRATCAG